MSRSKAEVGRLHVLVNNAVLVDMLQCCQHASGILYKVDVLTDASTGSQLSQVWACGRIEANSSALQVCSVWAADPLMHASEQLLFQQSSLSADSPSSCMLIQRCVPSKVCTKPPAYGRSSQCENGKQFSKISTGKM